MQYKKGYYLNILDNLNRILRQIPSFYKYIYTPQNGHGVFLSGISSFIGFLAIFSILVLNFSFI